MPNQIIPQYHIQQPALGMTSLPPMYAPFSHTCTYYLYLKELIFKMNFKVTSRT